MLFCAAVTKGPLPFRGACDGLAGFASSCFSSSSTIAAIMRHNNAGLAIPSFPWSTPDGGLLPAVWSFKGGGSIRAPGDGLHSGRWPRLARREDLAGAGGAPLFAARRLISGQPPRPGDSTGGCDNPDVPRSGHHDRPRTGGGPGSGDRLLADLVRAPRPYRDEMGAMRFGNPVHEREAPGFPTT